MDDIIKNLQQVSEEQRDINNRISEVIAHDKARLDELKERDELLRAKLLEAMEANDVKVFQNDVLRITYVAGQVRKTIDAKRFKEEAPEMYEEFARESVVKPSLRISVYEADL